MPFSIQLDGSSLKLALFGELTIAQARELADALKPVLSPNVALAVDASQLTRLDAAILQILLVCAQIAVDTTLIGTSPAWTAAFTRYASTDPFRIA
jgi:ABC-type transporter Mla MlaB component